MPPRKPEGVIPDLLEDLKDFDDLAPRADGDVPKWNNTTKMWVPGAAGGGGTPVWFQQTTRSKSIASGLADGHFAWDDAGTGDGDIAEDGNPYNTLLLPTGGLYYVTAIAAWAGNATGIRGMSTAFPASAGTPNVYEDVPAPSAAAFNQFVQRMLRMPDDGSGFIQFAVRQTSGGALDLDFFVRIDKIA